MSEERERESQAIITNCISKMAYSKQLQQLPTDSKRLNLLLLNIPNNLKTLDQHGGNHQHR
jgi:hypothetical protein